MLLQTMMSTLLLQRETLDDDYSRGIARKKHEKRGGGTKQLRPA
jgi:hypothetical protein